MLQFYTTKKTKSKFAKLWIKQSHIWLSLDGGLYKNLLRADWLHSVWVPGEINPTAQQGAHVPTVHNSVASD